MTIIGGANTYLASTITKLKGMVVIPYDDGSGFKRFRLYAWDADNTAWINCSLPDHKHSGADDGGFEFEIQVDNPNLILFIHHYEKVSLWSTANSGTGSGVSDQPTGSVGTVDLDTGTTSTGYARVYDNGTPIDFASRARINMNWQINAITNVLFRMGIAVEDVNAATDNNHKLGLEWCDSQAASNYYMLSANGSSRSLVDSTVPLAASAQHGVKIVHTPGVKSNYKFHNGTSIDKTTVLPSSATLQPNLVGYGVKNNNGGVVNRKLGILATVLVGKPNYTSWVV